MRGCCGNENGGGLRATEAVALGIAAFSLLLGTLFYREIRLRRLLEQRGVLGRVQQGRARCVTR